jgi:hypothetical protein
MPDTPVLEGGLPVVPYDVIDSVRYNDKLPWPVAADGGGPSLQRLDPAAYADDPANWFANGATPGRPNAQNEPPSVTLTAPTPDSSHTLPATILFEAAAADPDGAILKVEYLVDGNKVGEAAAPPYSFAWQATGGIHQVTAVAIDNSFGIGVSAPVAAYISNPASQGLRGDYYANRDLAVPLAFTRVDSTVDFDDYGGAWVNFGGVGSDQFSVRWSGQILAPASGTFTFHAAADDGVRLHVNGQQLVNAWYDQGETEYSATIQLTAGQLYPVVMEMYENWGGAAARLRWTGPGIAKQIIPQASLYPDSTPIVIEHPAHLVREQGSLATFRVIASGFGNSHQWRKNGVAIPGATGPELTLAPLWASDAGQYSAVVSNGHGFVFSNSAILAVTFTDSDGDGIQDSWELAHGLDPNQPADAALDSDGDGRDNLEEFLAGTDPRDPASRFVLDVTAVSGASGSYHLRFTAQPDKGYSIQYRDDLTGETWQNLPGSRIDPQRGGNPRPVEVTDSPPAGNRRFYRAVTPSQP